MNFRVEEDFVGKVRIPKEKLWGIQTQRAIENFKIGNEIMPFELIKSIGIVKKGCCKGEFEVKNS
jgi:fumarate hydratase class II